MNGILNANHCFLAVVLMLTHVTLVDHLPLTWLFVQ